MLLILLALPLISLQECKPEGECSWPKEWRRKALFRLDVLGGRAVPFASRTFAINSEYLPSHFTVKSKVLTEFVVDHGYFSCVNPLVGVVTTESSDIHFVEEALRSLLFEKDSLLREISVGEIVSKVLAYRNLEKGTHVFIPTSIGNTALFVEYLVDEIIDLWNGMPAFGLIPIKKKEASPLLLFRGTDFSLLSKRSWSSILSDLDSCGVGFSVFKDSQEKIHDWLLKGTKVSGLKHRVMFFSFGVVLYMYTSLFEEDLVAEKGSMAFNPPGVSSEIYDLWQKKKSTNITLYLTEGDLVSKLGKMVPKAFELQDTEHLGPIEAHTKLITADHAFSLSSVSIEEENKNRFTTK